MADRFGIDRKALVDAFAQAWRDEEASISKLQITVRARENGKAGFLVRMGQKIVAQLQFPNEIFEQPSVTDQLLDRLSHIPRRSPLFKTDKSATVSQLTVGQKVANLTASVESRSEEVLVHSRYGRVLRLALATLTDETGSVKVALWNSQIDNVHVGDRVEVTCRVRSFKGEMQLSLGKTGEIKTLAPAVL